MLLHRNATSSLGGVLSWLAARGVILAAHNLRNARLVLYVQGGG